ncbi:antitoxin Xre-like helix-turn-helix domain-containing protein [Phaeobacter gallaeciensis]|uniref:antitoxin Xre-like helix-turn-helix domain-containing protein n=1 Tax=Phaeobacter gallaeciensis TaxID=60890 RepID=UPI00237EF6E6|nr:antitoxin Xre-like helix-turn-helix domain-containing protein [Phaeobacter gallaeciensis]MDE4063968.1 antitoxin [Phaeobacter gallaeciensis]MDE4126989.1 antitoxin [Phaeobacter gallaeciensis]MDE4131467.1 antitoxin [Phaeobacter gallaeciensis]
MIAESETATPKVSPVPAELKNEAMRAFDLLGGCKVMNRNVHSSLDAHDLIIEGIPSQALLHLVDGVRVLMVDDVLNKTIGMSLHTLQRRTAEASGKPLSTAQSSRAWRFAKIFAQATDVLGAQQAAETWLLDRAIAVSQRLV